jgi:hypothetical protein
LEIALACGAAAFLFVAVATAAACVGNAEFGRISLIARTQPHRWQFVFGECIVLTFVMVFMTAMTSTGSWRLGLTIASAVLVVGSALVRFLVSHQQAKLARG